MTDLKLTDSPAVEVRDIKKSYGDLQAVDGVSFSLKEGENFGLLGPNGAGKTTTVSLLMGVLKADSGEITLLGQHRPTDSKARYHLGMAPQSLALYDNLTGRENLRFFGSLYDLSKKKLKERIDWCLDFVGLAPRGKDRVSTYSGGMKRRLNLACALVHDPKIIILDEPTVGVDPQSRNQIFENIEKLKEMERTVVYTTHYMEEAQRLCDRVAIMDEGKILALDTVEKLIAQYGGSSLVEFDFLNPPENRSQWEGEWEDNCLTMESDKPLELVARLVEEGLKFQKLEIIRSDLERVFLNLTGRSLRDE